MIFKKTKRKGLRDMWNAFMCYDAMFGPNDIPFCPTTADEIPTEIITWTEAVSIYNKERTKNIEFFYDAFICFYEDDYKFDSPNTGIWFHPYDAYKIIRHFAGIITPDYSTYQDFPLPLKIYNTYRMRAFGYWIGKLEIQVINNLRWGTDETYDFSAEGIPVNSIIAIGTVGGSPQMIINRNRFNTGLNEMVKRLNPHTIIVYGSANYPCFDELRRQGITIVDFPSKTAQAFAKGGYK